jgi:hypothetical protein
VVRNFLGFFTCVNFSCLAIFMSIISCIGIFVSIIFSFPEFSACQTFSRLSFFTSINFVASRNFPCVKHFRVYHFSSLSIFHSPIFRVSNFCVLTPFHIFYSSNFSSFVQIWPPNLCIMNLFTVEQLELVRRLKTSGMSADKIIEVGVDFSLFWGLP